MIQIFSFQILTYPAERTKFFRSAHCCEKQRPERRQPKEAAATDALRWLRLDLDMLIQAVQNKVVNVPYRFCVNRLSRIGCQEYLCNIEILL